ncbi:hypothetical protein JCM10207_006139 [Rhodosporidiobolus poonsookiae]
MPNPPRTPSPDSPIAYRPPPPPPRRPAPSVAPSLHRWLRHALGPVKWDSHGARSSWLDFDDRKALRLLPYLAPRQFHNSSPRPPPVLASCRLVPEIAAGLDHALRDYLDDLSSEDGEAREMLDCAGFLIPPNLGRGSGETYCTANLSLNMHLTTRLAPVEHIAASVCSVAAVTDEQAAAEGEEGEEEPERWRCDYDLKWDDPSLMRTLRADLALYAPCAPFQGAHAKLLDGEAAGVRAMHAELCALERFPCLRVVGKGRREKVLARRTGEGKWEKATKAERLAVQIAMILNSKQRRAQQAGVPNWADQSLFVLHGEVWFLATPLLDESPSTSPGRTYLRLALSPLYEFPRSTRQSEPRFLRTFVAAALHNARPDLLPFRIDHALAAEGLPLIFDEFYIDDSPVESSGGAGGAKGEEQEDEGTVVPEVDLAAISPSSVEGETGEKRSSGEGDGGGQRKRLKPAEIPEALKMRTEYGFVKTEDSWSPVYSLPPHLATAIASPPQPSVGNSAPPARPRSLPALLKLTRIVSQSHGCTMLFADESESFVVKLGHPREDDEEEKRKWDSDDSDEEEEIKSELQAEILAYEKLVLLPDFPRISIVHYGTFATKSRFTGIVNARAEPVKKWKDLSDLDPFLPLSLLHAASWIHGDIRASNFVIALDGSGAKLIDFSRSEPADQEEREEEMQFLKGAWTRAGLEVPPGY